MSWKEVKNKTNVHSSDLSLSDNNLIHWKNTYEKEILPDSFYQTLIILPHRLPENITFDEPERIFNKIFPLKVNFLWVILYIRLVFYIFLCKRGSLLGRSLIMTKRVMFEFVCAFEFESSRKGIKNSARRVPLEIKWLSPFHGLGRKLKMSR